MLRTGSKIQCQRDFEMAAQSLGYSMPFSVVCEDNHIVQLAKYIEKGQLQAVLKRDYSDGAQHVLVPGMNQASRIAKAAISQTKQDWTPLQAFFGRPPSWILQPLVNDLQSIGEVRAFVIGGNLIVNMLTVPGQDSGDWTCRSLARVPPLNEIRCVSLGFYVMKILILHFKSQPIDE